MNSIERMKAARTMESPDHIPFLPTILEHAAAVAGLAPSAAAQHADLLTRAHVEAWRRYGHDSVIVGIDVYNAEAEALGCEVRYYQDSSVPGIVGRPGAGVEPSKYAGTLAAAAAGALGRGRLPMLLSAAGAVKAAIGGEVPVGLGVSGPFSVCCELMGFEDFILTCIENPDAANGVLETVAAFLSRWCLAIVQAGLGITLFESWAAPPLLSPPLYRRFALPWERALITAIRNASGRAPALVIGGDTSAILPDMLSSGTGLVIADYNTEFAHYLDAARQAKLPIRGNIDPKLVACGPVGAVLEQAEKRIRLANGYPGFLLGTGVLPYETPEGSITALRDLCRKAGKQS